MSTSNLRSRRRTDYPYHLDYRTRWSDNDMYGHLNNSTYSLLFDSVINTYLIRHCHLNPSPSPSPTSTLHTPTISAKNDTFPSSSQNNHIYLVISSHASYFSPTSFPAVLDLGLRVTRLGNSSVSYEVGVFGHGNEEVKVVGGFTHVCVERGSRKVIDGGIGEKVRRGLGALVVDGEGKGKL